MTIKHLIYMQKVPFNGTERDYVIFSGSKIHAGRKVIILLYMKGAQKIVSASNERQSLGVSSNQNGSSCSCILPGLGLYIWQNNFCL